MTRVGAKRTRERQIILHAAVRVRASVPADSPEGKAVAIALQSNNSGNADNSDSKDASRDPPGNNGGRARGGTTSPLDGVRNRNAAHRYGKAVVAAVSFSVGQLGGARLMGKGAVRLLSAAWEDVRGAVPVSASPPPDASGTRESAKQGRKEGKVSLTAAAARLTSEWATQNVSRTLRLVLVVDGLASAVAARLVRTACVCVRSIAVSLDVPAPSKAAPSAEEDEGSSRGRTRQRKGGQGEWVRVRIPHEVALRVVRA